MLAAQHIGGGLLLLVGAALVVVGIAMNRVWNGWLLYGPGAAMAAAGLYLVTR